MELEQPTIIDEVKEQMEQDKEIQKQLDNAIKLGRALKNLRENKDYKLLFEEMFIKTGLDILWDNLRHLNEEQLKGRGGERNAEIIDRLMEEVKVRLKFESFCDTVEHDANNAIEAIRDMKEEVA